MLATSNQNLQNMATHSQASSSTTIQFSESHIKASNLTPVKQTVTVLPITNTGAYHYTTPSRQSTNEQAQTEQPTNPIQVKNYINWVNTHLKKRPGVKLIENLQTDMRDGVALIHLIEVISGNVLADVNLNPKTNADYKDNIDKVLRFMHHNSIKMHQTTTKDIVDGVLKPTMRLILSLAAHFKPTNVQHYSTAQAHGITESHGKSHGSSSSTSPYVSGSKSAHRLTAKDDSGLNGSAIMSSGPNHDFQTGQSATSNRPVFSRTHDSMTHLVQAACVNLADARRYNNQPSQNFNVKYVKRNNLTDSSSPSDSKHSSNQERGYPVNKTDPSHSSTHPEAFSRSGDFKPPAPFVSSPNVHPLASSTIISSSNAPTSPTSKALPSVLPIKHANIKIEIKDASNDSQSNSKETTKSSNGSSTIKSERTVCEQPSQPGLEKSPAQSDLNNELMAMLGNFDDDFSHDMKGLKNVLLKLQSLLMNCSNQELTRILDAEASSDQMEKTHDSASKECSNNIIEQNRTSDSDEVVSGLTPAEQIAILRSRIQQLEILSSDLRNELNHAKSESMHSAGVHSGLKSRVNEQDNTILEMKKEQLNLHMINQQLEKEKEELMRKLDERAHLINRLKHELNCKNEQMDNMRADIISLTREKEEQAKYVKHQDRVVKTVTSVIEKVQENGTVLAERLESTNRKLGMIETCHKDGNGKETNGKGGNHVTQRQQNHHMQMLPVSAIISNEEANFLRESLLKLRQNIHSSHPSQLILNHLEHGFATILERSNQLNSASSSYASSSSSCTSSSANSPVMSMMPALNTIQLGSNLSAPSSSSSSSSSAYSSSSLITVHRQPAMQQQAGMFLNSNGVYQSEDDACKHRNESVDKLEQAHPENANEQSPFTANEGNVKKIISRFFSHTGSQLNGGSSGLSSSLPPPVNPKRNDAQKQPPTNSLLAISSSNSSAPSPSPPSLSSYSSASVATATTSTSIKGSTSSATMPSSSSSSVPSSKIIYYLSDKNATPYMTSISKPLNSITLKDFKELLKVKPSQNLRFYFKSQDPEFGIVREEISNENALLPSFEGRVIAWISENETN